MKGSSLFSLPRLLLLLVLTTVPAHADHALRTVEHEGVHVVLSKNDNSNYYLSVSVPPGASPKAFVLEHPARIVIDLANHRGNRNFESAISGDPVVRRIRIGSHPDMMRIVVDLAADGMPALDVSPAGDQFRVRFSASAAGLENANSVEPALTEQPHSKAEPTAVAAPTETAAELPPTLLRARRGAGAVVPPLPSHEAAAAPTPEAAVATPPVSTPAPAETPRAALQQGEVTPEGSLPASSPTNAPGGGAQLQDIRFDFLGANKTPVVRLVLSNRPVFEVVRRSAEEYEFVFSGVSVPPKHLLLPRFPPQDFQGFTHVSCEPVQETPGKIKVRVGIAEGYRLQYLPRDNEIWLKVNAKTEG